MFLLSQGADGDRLLCGGPQQAHREGSFVVRWGDAQSIRRVETPLGFRLELVNGPSDQNASLITWDGIEHCFAITRPWPGRVSIYLSKNGRNVSSHLRFLVQVGEPICPMPTLIAPGTHHMIGAGQCAYRMNQGDLPAPHFQPYLSLEHAAEKLRTALTRALSTLPSDAVILLSGGIDSAAIAAAAPPGTRCVTWTTAKAAPPDTDGSDHSAARRVADHLGMPHDTLDLIVGQLQANVDLAVLLGEVKRGTLIDDLVVYVEVARALRCQGVRTIVIGEAADDALGCLPSNLRFLQGPKLLNKLRRDYELGMTADHAAIAKVFGAFGIDVIDPYLSPPVAEIARRIPLEMRVDAARLMKPILRQAFREELPVSIIARPKRVSRDVSGVRTLMEERFGKSRERFLPIFNAFFRTKDSVTRQREILDRLAHEGHSGSG